MTPPTLERVASEEEVEKVGAAIASEHFSVEPDDVRAFMADNREYETVRSFEKRLDRLARAAIEAMEGSHSLTAGETEAPGYPRQQDKAYRLCIDRLVRVINSAVSTLEMDGRAYSAQAARQMRDEALRILEPIKDIHDAVLSGASGKTEGEDRPDAERIDPLISKLNAENAIESKPFSRIRKQHDTARYVGPGSKA